MYPEVITRIVEIVTAAHVHLFVRMGSVIRAASATSRVVVATDPTRPQLIGARYGMGTGVKSDN